MKKNLKNFIFLFIISFVFITNINATTREYSCTYRNKDNDSDKYELTFRISGNKVNVINCLYNESNCLTDKYEFIFGDVKEGDKYCPSSIDAVNEDDVTKIKWITDYKGRYIYSHQWDCIYEVVPTYKAYRFKFEYWDGAYLIKDAIEYSFGGFYTGEVFEQPDPLTGKTMVVKEFLNPFTSNQHLLPIITSAINEEGGLLEVFTKYDAPVGSSFDDVFRMTKNVQIESEKFFFYKKLIEYDYSVENLIDSDTTTKSCPNLHIELKNASSLQKVTLVDNPIGIGPYTVLKKDISYVANRTTTEFKSGYDSCLNYTRKGDCETSSEVACIWNELDKSINSDGGYCNVDKLTYVACGDAFDIPKQVPQLISLAVNLLKIATPIILIIVSVISLVKTIASSKEDEIKKAQQGLIKKIVAAFPVFFIVSIVQFVIAKVADDGEYDSVDSCLDCFLNNHCSTNTYYKNNVAGTYICTQIDGTLMNTNGTCPEDLE